MLFAVLVVLIAVAVAIETSLVVAPSYQSDPTRL
jgi:hypothetical protein